MSENIKQKIEELLTRGVSEIIGREELVKKLSSKEKLRIKFGIDPTSPNIHLGRATSLLKLRDFQDLGHQVVFIVGDFTGVIGDTSDKESERPMLDEETVKQNMQSYREQAAKILDMDKVEFHYNSDWLGKLTYKEIGKQADAFSLAEFAARENIKKRMDEGKRVSLREVLYPLMQGYDSVEVRADVEIGGTDQRFNLLAGRELQRLYDQQPQNILTLNLIEGTDGRKMSSSWGNVINVSENPSDMFGKVMSMGDELIVKYFVHCTRVPLAAIEKIEKAMTGNELNPRDAKMQLAEEIVKIYHGGKAAKEAREYFISTFSKKEIPADLPEYAISGEQRLLEVLVQSGNAKSISDARRKVEQGGVTIEGEKIMDVNFVVSAQHKDKVLKIGKLGFLKLV